MSMFGKKTINLCMLNRTALSLVTILTVSTQPSWAAKSKTSASPNKAIRFEHELREIKRAPEKFAATEDDGTAQMIHASTNVEADKPKEEFLEDENAVASSDPVTPAVKETPIKRPSETTQVPKQEKLPQKKTSLEEHVIAEASNDAPSDDSGDVGVNDLTETAEASKTSDGPTLDTRSIDGRVQEKMLVSEQTRKTEATALKKELHHKTVLNQANKYDLVPDKYISDLAQRLKYTNEILKRFGRAYDYRMTTLSEFKKVLANLEADEKKSATKTN